MLAQIHDSLWTTTSSLIVLQWVHMNTRMTIIRLSNGSLLLHSPVPWSPELQAAIQKIGSVQYIVAPSCFHHMFVGKWKNHNPDAKICAPKGLRKKRSDLDITYILQEHTDLWQNEIQYFAIKGIPILQEHIFYHNSSKTLIVTDLFFHLPESTGFTSLYASINGVKNTVATTLLFKAAIKDREAFRSSLKVLRDMEVNVLSLCHHDVLIEDVSAHIAQALNKLKVPTSPSYENPTERTFSFSSSSFIKSLKQTNT